MTFATAFCRAAALCLLAGAAHASPHTVAAAQADAPVPPTRYQPAAYAPSAPSAVTPDQAWREQNRIVAAYDSMRLTMPGDAGHGQHAHAGHAAPAADPHAGHKMAADPHAGHKMPADPHAGHKMAADPHAGHKMPADPHAAHRMPAGAAADPHAGHRMHDAASKAGCACCGGKDGAQDAGMCMAPAAGHGMHAAMGAATPAKASGCCDGAGKDCCKDGCKEDCCKRDCCKDGCRMAAAPASAKGGHQHEGHH